jgi:hypothetical protein
MKQTKQTKKSAASTKSTKSTKQASSKTTKKSTATETISKTKAVSLISESAGRFIRVSFTTASGASRTLGCKFKELTNLGNIKVLETATSKNPGGYKTIVAKNIQELSCNGCTYKVRK